MCINRAVELARCFNSKTYRYLCGREGGVQFFWVNVRSLNFQWEVKIKEENIRWKQIRAKVRIIWKKIEKKRKQEQQPPHKHNGKCKTVNTGNAKTWNSVEVTVFLGERRRAVTKRSNALQRENEKLAGQSLIKLKIFLVPKLWHKLSVASILIP